jgi:F-type H+-transporting ATPase subunit gamma
MAGSREIRTKIKSVQSTRKITKAMEMVAASKMKKAQDRMRATRPYVLKIWQIAGHLAHANSEVRDPFLQPRDDVKNIGLIVVTSDKGLCGGLNSNVLRMALGHIKEWTAEGKGVQVTAIGSKGLGFMQRLGAKIVSSATGLGDRPKLDRVTVPVQVQLKDFREGRIDRLYVIATQFVNTMKQTPNMVQLLPLHKGEDISEGSHAWDYIYEPDAAEVLRGLLVRYLEAVIYQAVNESMASEQSARMVAMKAATDNAGNIIKELQLIYNKTRQAAITKELSEIVAGAAAV